MSVDQITREHHQRIEKTAEAYFAAVQRGERGTPLEWHQKQFSNALLDARNAIGTSKTALEGAMERAIAAGNPDLFRRHLPGAQAIAAVEEAVVHAAPAVATPAAHVAEELVEHAAPALRESRLRRFMGGVGHAVRDMRASLGEAISFKPVPRDISVNMREPRVLRVAQMEEPLGLSPQMEHYVDHQPSLPPGTRADALAHQAIAEMPAADLAALKAKPSLLPIAAPVEAAVAAPTKPLRGFTHKIRGLALGGALASSSLPAVAADTHGEIWRGAPLEPVAHRAHAEGARPASAAIPRAISIPSRASTEFATPPVTLAAPIAAVELPTPSVSAEVAAGPTAPNWRTLSDTPFGPPAPPAKAAAPAHAALPAVIEPTPSRAERVKQAMRKLWPFGKKIGDAHDVPFISNAHPTPAANGGIILPEIGKTAEIATESKGRPGLIVAGTLAAVGGAAFLASGGQHQQREYQRRLDAAALSQDQGIA